jgi:hypothetical protein
MFKQIHHIVEVWMGRGRRLLLFEREAILKGAPPYVKEKSVRMLLSFCSPITLSKFLFARPIGSSAATSPKFSAFVFHKLMLL